MDKKIEKSTVDGRRAEVHTFEAPLENGHQRVTEHYEEIIPYEKKMRVTENVVPVVVQRVVEQFVNGQSVKTVEAVDRAHLIPAQAKSTLTSTDVDNIEGIIRRIISESDDPVPEPEMEPEQPVSNPSFMNKMFGGNKVVAPVHVPITPVAPVATSAVSDYVGYALVVILAVGVSVIVWQLFIR